VPPGNLCSRLALRRYRLFSFSVSGLAWITKNAPKGAKDAGESDRRAVNPDQASCETCVSGDTVVDAPGLAFGFGILTADDDAGMFRGLEVKSDEVTPVQSQHRSTQRSREGQYLCVWYGSD
jgi:hypothetical protein